MKKFVFVFGLLFFFSLHADTVQALNYDNGSLNYWSNWIQKFSRPKTYRTSGRKSRYDTPSYYRKRTRPRTFETKAEPIYQEHWKDQQEKGLLEDKTYVPPKRNVESIYRPRRTFFRRRSNNSLKITTNTIRQGQPVRFVEQGQVRIFQLNVKNTSNIKSTQISEAILLDKMQFQVYSNNGIAADPRKFALVVNGTARKFDMDGNLTVQFGNARITQGNSLEINVDLKVDDPEFTPNIPGNMRVRIVGATALTESSQKSIRPQFAGGVLSEQIIFDPIPQTSGTPVFVKRTQKIYSKTLSAGEKALVSALHFQAHFDDMMIDRITLRDSLSNGKIDSFVNKIRAIDMNSGRVLAETRFSGGEATFYFRPGIRINREEQRHVGFEVYLDSVINTSAQNTQFQLDALSNDIVVRGIGSGKDVPDSNKNFATDSEKFLVVNSGGSMRVYAGNQPRGFAVTDTSHNQIYRFVVSNPGARDISLARLSFDVVLSGLNFPNGISTDDFKLKEIYNGFEANGESFTASSVSGSSMVTFDANTEFLIKRHSHMEFVLKAKLEDVGGDSDSDSLAVSILGDSSSSTGTLSSVRSGGAKFIWSDHSGRPHTLNSADWLSGYLVSGLPTNKIVIKRNP